jgi:N-acetylmuramoyl-L-alanine amidase
LRVVLDPGHGGSDSGAISKHGLMEKNITLDIAKRLKHLLEHNLPHVEVVLTRTADTYVSLEERIRVAHRKPGDLFLSLHINSSESKKASGFEIYSLDVASDRHAERLAARENKVESKNSRGVNFILADLRAFSNRKDSDRLAKSVALGLKAQLKKTKAASSISDRGYNQAIFHVLFVKMPAILAELFFISNPQEEKMLSEKIYRDAIARGLFVGVKNFLASKKSGALRAENAK